VPLDVAQCGVADGGQRTASFGRDLVDGPLWPVADLLGAHLAHQVFVGQALECPVHRAGLDVGPVLGAIGLRLLPDLMSVQRPARGERAQDEEADR